MDQVGTPVRGLRVRRTRLRRFGLLLLVVFVAGVEAVVLYTSYTLTPRAAQAARLARVVEADRRVAAVLEQATRAAGKGAQSPGVAAVSRRLGAAVAADRAARTAYLLAVRSAGPDEGDLQLLLLGVSVLMVLVPGSVLYSQHRLAQSELRGAYVQLIDALEDSVRANEALEEARAEADRRSRTDALTGVGNRRRFAEALETIFAEHVPAVVLLVDVDHFKRVNDSYGHHAGDRVLVETVRRLSAALPSDALVGRWGGEEFAALITGEFDERRLRELAEGVRRAVAAEPIRIGQDSIWITLSIGVARRRDHHASLDDLMADADIALYLAKHTGRNAVQFRDDLSVDAAMPVDDGDATLLAQAFSVVAGAREGTAQGHAAQVAELAIRTSLELGLEPRLIRRVQLTAWLHDLGKIAIPERILFKPGSLDEHEWATMRRHAVIGEALVRRFASLAPAADGVRHHHERYDGSGYPDGLAGEGIPIEARIVAAADTFAAMTNDRCYRKQVSHQEAVRELRRVAGTQLDPRVVEALLNVLARPLPLPLRGTDTDEGDQLVA